MDPSPALALIVTKLEPKPEPYDDVTPQIPNPQNPNPNPNSDILTPEIHTPLQQLTPSSLEEELFAEYCRLAERFKMSAVAFPAVAKKKNPRSREIVRVSNLTAQDHFFFRDSVRRARITYESLRILLSHEETRCRRPDLKAAAFMKERGLWLHREKRIVGSIPGIQIGDVFLYRMELLVVGLHGQVQAGIDYVTGSNAGVATSIIVSGGYEDDDDKGDELVYTGQGGRKKNQQSHSVPQDLKRGNKGLELSMENGIELRVMRGVRVQGSPTGKVYVYDGLYRVVAWWAEEGKSGFEVFKYKLVRIEGQEEMGSVVMRKAEELKVNPVGLRPNGFFFLDISKGMENFPVSVFNDIDELKDPIFFQYVVRPVYHSAVEKKIFGDWGSGCTCVAKCTSDCYCAKLNGGELPYDDNGILLKGKPVVYECGSACKCPPNCTNRVSQKGLRNRLEVFRSRETNWGVRSFDLIRAGSFICEFSGKVLTKQLAEIDRRGECFVCPSKFPGRWMEWGDISDVCVDYTTPTLPSLPEPGFLIDVSEVRNVASYMSHSYNPNVFVQFVLYDHYNVAYPHIMIFAVENILPMRELSIDYGVIDELVGRITM